MKRILLISLGSVLGLCVICAGLLYFVALPRAQDSIAGQFQDGLPPSSRTGSTPRRSPRANT